MSDSPRATTGKRRVIGPAHQLEVRLLYIHVSWLQNYCFGNICSVHEAFSCGNSPFLTKQWATKGLCRRAHTQAVYMISVVIVSVTEFLTTDIWLPRVYSVAVTALFLQIHGCQTALLSPGRYLAQSSSFVSILLFNVFMHFQRHNNNSTPDNSIIEKE